MRMSQEFFVNIQQAIIRDEGVKLMSYQDTVGVWTIGVGHNMEADKHMSPPHNDKMITEQQALSYLRDDLDVAFCDCGSVFSGFLYYTEERQQALVNMMFNLGLTKFKEFRKMIKYIQVGDWINAAVEAVDSKWALQVGTRAVRIAQALYRSKSIC